MAGSFQLSIVKVPRVSVRRCRLGFCWWFLSFELMASGASERERGMETEDRTELPVISKGL
jgi:hypothetical protein